MTFCYFCYLFDKWELGMSEAEALADAGKCDGDDDDRIDTPATSDELTRLQTKANTFYGASNPRKRDK